MALRGNGALAMWWDMSPGMRAEFEHWHTHEHFPERLALPGFLRASRWADADGGEGFFVLYELAQRDDLASPEYLARLNAPTPWSRQLMPHHRNMVRSQCVVLESEGAMVSAYALTMRFSPRGDGPGERERLRSATARIAAAAGCAGAHLLKTDAPAIATTVEQQIRGNADTAADWVFIVCGYEPAALRGLDVQALGVPGLATATRGIYRLSLAAVPGDV